MCVRRMMCSAKNSGEEAAGVMAVGRGRIRLKKSMAEGVPEVALHTALGRDSVIGR